MSQYQPPRRERRSTVLESNAQDRVELSQEHADAVRTTEEHACARETVRGHNRRLQTMIKWFMENYEEECRDIVRDLTSREKEDKDRFWKSTHDLVYEKLDPLVVKAFISGNKVREERSDGTKLFYSYDHLRKYKDAILFGAKRARRSLPPNYDPEMEPFMQSLKKENQSKRKLGQVTEKEADPISFPLYRHICQTALTEGDIFVWCFTIMQWNCIARSINIGNLRFNCLSVGQDSCVVKYWDTKKDKTGEKTCPKNCYANPKDPSICFFTSLGLVVGLKHIAGGCHPIIIAAMKFDRTAVALCCSAVASQIQQILESSTTATVAMLSSCETGRTKRNGRYLKGGSIPTRAQSVWYLTDTKGDEQEFLHFTGMTRKSFDDLVAICNEYLDTTMIKPGVGKKKKARCKRRKFRNRDLVAIALKFLLSNAELKNLHVQFGSAVSTFTELA